MNKEDDDTIRALFTEAEALLSTESSKTAVNDISLTDSVTNIDDTERERIKLLFALAEDELNGLPTPQFASVDTSTEREVFSPELQSQLTQVTSFIDSQASSASLKKNIEMQQASGIRATKLGSNLGSKANIQGSFTERVRAAIIDLLLCSFLSFTIGSIFFRGGLVGLVADLSVHGVKKYHSVVLIVGLAFLPAVVSLYTFITTLSLNGTLGQRITGLILQNRSGRPLRASQVLLRSFTSPFEIFLVGLIPIKFKKNAFVDSISRCCLYRKTL